MSDALTLAASLASLPVCYWLGLRLATAAQAYADSCDPRSLPLRAPVRAPAPDHAAPMRFDSLPVLRCGVPVHVRLVEGAALGDHRPRYVGGHVVAVGLSRLFVDVECTDGTTRRVHVEDVEPETAPPAPGRQAA